MLRSFEDQWIDLDGKNILITGGTGSFGKAFVRKVLDKFKPRRLIIFSRDELKQYEMAQKLNPEVHKCLRYFIGDIRDSERLHMALRDVDYVVHAAAMKQVPTAEYNPFECIKTNVIGADNLVQTAIQRDVKVVLALSTDKAANPANLYGASKLASDKIFIAANNLSGRKGTKFSVVRYGNVVGSRGSVIPLYSQLIKDGAKELPVTDDRMTRFLITLDQGTSFVLSCMGMMRGGEILIPKIPSAKITDIAAVMAPGMKQKIIGIRPGEKLHEVMVTAADSRNTVEFDDRYAIEPVFAWWDRHSYLEKNVGSLVKDGFAYASDINEEWLDEKELKSLLADHM